MSDTMTMRAAMPVRRIRGTTEKLADAVLEARKKIEAVKGRDELTEEAKAERIQGHREALLDAADEIQRYGARYLDRARERAMPPGPPSDPAEATLYETRKGRAWARIRPMLDSGRDPRHVAEHLVANQDRVGIAALREELPTYRELHRQDGETPASTAHMTQLILREVGEVERPLLSDEELEKRDALADAERAHSFLTTNLGMVRQEREGTFFLAGEAGEDGSVGNVELGADAR